MPTFPTAQCLTQLKLTHEPARVTRQSPIETEEGKEEGGGLRHNLSRAFNTLIRRVPRRLTAHAPTDERTKFPPPSHSI